MQIVSKEPDFLTIEIRRFKQDAFADQFHQFSRVRYGNDLLAAVAANPNFNIGQVNVFQSAFNEVVMSFLEDKMLAAACRAFFEMIRDRLSECSCPVCSFPAKTVYGSSPRYELTCMSYPFWYKILFTSPDGNFLIGCDHSVCPLNHNEIFS
jgi:hypothetical protein